MSIERGAARALSQDVPGASEFGLKVARILDDIWALYNIPWQVKASDFTSERFIEVRWDRDLATFDFDALTQLVVRCHDACVRLSMCGRGGRRRCLTLMFHPRNGREGAMYERHPTIEDAIAKVRARNYFGETPSRQVVK